MPIIKTIKGTPRLLNEEAKHATHPSFVGFLSPYLKIHRPRIIFGFFLILFLSLLALPSPLLMKYLIDEIFLKRKAQGFYLILFILILFQIIRLIFSFLNSYVFSNLNHEIITSIKRDLFYKILRLPMSFFDSHQIGYITSRIDEASGLNTLFSNSLIGLLIGFFEFLFSLLILFRLQWKLTLISVSILPLFYIAGKFYAANIRTASMKMKEKGAQLSKVTQESLFGIEVIKMFTAEDRETEKIYSYLNDLKKTSIKNSVLLSFSSEGLSLVGAIGGFLVLWFSGVHIIQGSFTIGAYIAYTAYLAKLYGPILNIAITGISLQPALTTLNRVSEYFNIKGEDEDTNRSVIISTISEGLELRKVAFAYDGADVIKNVSFTLKKGTKTLLKGPNGAGKTTILKLIMGFYHPRNGQILIDGQDINFIKLSSLRDRISVVSQKVFLFNDTIYNNILYSNPTATKAAVEEAMTLSGLFDFNLGSNEIGELGNRLSGGEKQKVSIARAILKDSDMIILDEATSNLDSESTKRITTLLKDNFNDKICLIVSHREWDELNIDKIISIENGEIS